MASLLLGPLLRHVDFPTAEVLGPDYDVDKHFTIAANGRAQFLAVTAHELGHMWVPMIVSTDERRYAWFDEGTTTFNENQGRRDFFPGSNPGVGDVTNYLSTVRAGAEGEMMRWSNYHYPGPAYVTASYYKPAVVLEAEGVPVPVDSKSALAKATKVLRLEEHRKAKTPAARPAA